MQRLLIMMVVFLVVVGCNKEDELYSTKVSDLYVFKPDDTDLLKKRVYEIYKEYGVALFFKDTVGQYFVRNDINGNPVYRTERLDLGWSFHTSKQSTFQVVGIETLDEQMEAIAYAEKYLKSISKPLYPFSLLLVRELHEISSTGDTTKYKAGEAVNYFRTLMMSDRLLSKDTTAHFKEIAKKIIRTAVNNYPDYIERFGVVSGDLYGGKTYSVLDPSYPSGTSVGLLYLPALAENLKKTQGWSDARIEAEKVRLRRVCGQFGFVSGNETSGGYFTPSGVPMDLDGYLREILKTNKETFKANWGEYPLVMKKYNLLHELIWTKLGVDL